MKQSRIKTLLLVYCPPLIAALLARGLLFGEWLESPLRYYHLLGGLDMKTLLVNGSLFHNMETTFSIYNFLLAAVMFFNKGAHCVEALVMLQMLFGCFTSLLTAYIALRISGRRYFASICGIVAAVYAPALLYECAALQDSVFLFVNVLSMSVILKARTRHFSPFWMFLAGFAIALPMLMRFSPFLWMLSAALWIMLYVFGRLKKESGMMSGKMLKAFLFFCVGISAAFLPVSAFHLSKGWGALPFPFPNLRYNLEIGSVKNPESLNFPATESSEEKYGNAEPVKMFLRKAELYYGKLLFIFKSFEIPNNLNYYFFKNYLPLLNSLAGPLFLIPAALSGIIIMLAKRRFLRRESILFFYLVSFIIPLCAFFPLGRYRLVFLPVFCIFAVYFFMRLFREFIKVSRGGRFHYFIIAILLYVIIFRWSAPSYLPLRAEDFVAYGQALEIQKGDIPEVETCFSLALLANPESKSAALNLTDKLISHAKFEKARKIIGPFYFQDMQNYKFAIKYASAMLGLGKPVEAEEVLKQLVPPENKTSQYNYFFNLGESRRLQGKNAEAAEAYEKAMELTDRKELLEILKSLIEKVRKSGKP